jgi:hypothetical protein
MFEHPQYTAQTTFRSQCLSARTGLARIREGLCFFKWFIGWKLTLCYTVDQRLLCFPKQSTGWPFRTDRSEGDSLLWRRK